ncbi:hypothetical protein [Halopseudomonas maritima]|uniref:hypothetical protein n=1 Tax=Halopseudomonas maritima TaxID=2918528 RepID=UPI001EEBA298|nr:hypothetical protein [Halopseudomonas maritima]UJJ32610.1 hypothetical protein HV822_05465 [Halopseudomonas maritima]
MPYGIALFLVWLVLLLRFPRVMLPVSGVIAAVGLLLGVIMGVLQWQQNQRVEQLGFSLQYQPADCPFGKPLAVVVRNHGEQTARNITWQLWAYQQGYNSNLLDVGSSGQRFSLPGELPAGAQSRVCYSIPRLRSGYSEAELQYRTDTVRADFKQQ